MAKKLPGEIKKRNQVILGIQKAIEATFSESDWKQLGYQTGTQDWIAKHPRLLRSLSWGDSDYHHAELIEELDVQVYPGVRRAGFATCRGPVGAGLAESETAPPAVVPAGRHRVQWKSISSNRRNRAIFPVLGAVCEC